jgi:hypothetical protein
MISTRSARLKFNEIMPPEGIGCVGVTLLCGAGGVGDPCVSPASGADWAGAC